ncbi:DUF6709 family protein [Haloimpatiens sp. FM7330]|uniref:DUF6709 family protein n=1 Tax=Haloimpatiens sp. FM7330 TaxID=3298610 RepID=UPI0036356694
MDRTNFIKNYKRRWKYRGIALAACIIMIITTAIAGVYVYCNNENNPFVVQNFEDYKKALDEDKYIQISSDKLYDLHVDVVTTRKKFGISVFKSVKSKCVAIKLEPFILAVELPNKDFEKFMSQEKETYVLKGKLVELKDKDLETLKSAIKDNYSLSGGAQMQPYLQYLKCETPMNTAALFFVLSGLLLICIVVLYTRVMKKNTIALKSLKNFSNEDFERTCYKIDQELNSSNTYKNGPISITENYVVVQTQQIVFALPLRELMWVYKENIKNKIFFVIPVCKTNRLTFVFSDKNTYTVDLYRSEKVIDEVIEYISKNCKTCFVGYTEELNNLFKKDCDEFMFKWRCHKENSTNMNM